MTLKATNTNDTLDGLSFPTLDAVVRSSQVPIVASPDPATAPVIMGGAIDVESASGGVPLVLTLLAGQGASDNAYASWGQWVSGLLNSAFQSLGHLPKLGNLTLPLSVNYRNAATSVLVGQNAQITGGNNVTILANSTADAQGTAVYSRNTTFGAAIAFMMGVTDPETDIQNGVVINSTGGQVQIQSNAVSTAYGVARVSQNSEGTSSKNNIQLGLAVGGINQTAHATVETGAKVVAAGAVDLEANGTGANTIIPTTTSFVDGRAGAAIGVNIAHNDIKATVGGTLIAGGSGSTAKPITIDPFVNGIDSRSKTPTNPAIIGLD